MHPSRFLLSQLALALILSGCARTGGEVVAQGQAALQSSNQLVSDVTGIGFPFLEIDKVTEFSLDGQSKVMERDGVRYFVQGFALPEVSPPFSISVASIAQGGPESPAILYPSVRLLDANHQAIDEIALDQFVFRGSAMGGELSAEVFINDSARSPTFIVIENRRVDDSNLVISQSNLTSVAPLTAGAAMIFVPTGTSSDPVPMKAAATGKLTLLVARYQPKRIQD